MSPNYHSRYSAGRNIVGNDVGYGAKAGAVQRPRPAKGRQPSPSLGTQTPPDSGPVSMMSDIISSNMSNIDHTVWVASAHAAASPPYLWHLSVTESSVALRLKKFGTGGPR